MVNLIWHLFIYLRNPKLVSDLKTNLSSYDDVPTMSQLISDGQSSCIKEFLNELQLLVVNVHMSLFLMWHFIGHFSCERQRNHEYAYVLYSTCVHIFDSRVKSFFTNTLYILLLTIWPYHNFVTARVYICKWCRVKKSKFKHAYTTSCYQCFWSFLCNILTSLRSIFLKNV